MKWFFLDLAGVNFENNRYHEEIIVFFNRVNGKCQDKCPASTIISLDDK